MQFIGKIDNILRFVNSLPNRPRELFLQNPALLQALLKEYSIDIWFTVEGTAAIGTRSQVLDGDLLSAATGTIVVPQSALLPADVPAGLPQRGVDFGLDGIATPRDPDLARKVLYFSTEILYDGEKTSFTDGDMLRLADGIEKTNLDLIKPFHPAADFLGLDALSLGSSPGVPKDPNIQKLCGDQRFVSEFDGGLVPINGAGSGLYQGVFTDDPRGQPCGLYRARGRLRAAGRRRDEVPHRVSARRRCGAPCGGRSRHARYPHPLAAGCAAALLAGRLLDSARGQHLRAAPRDRQPRLDERQRLVQGVRWHPHRLRQPQPAAGRLGHQQQPGPGLGSA